MVIRPRVIRMGHVGHMDENRNVYCAVMSKPEGKLSIYVTVILKQFLKK
jgi:hypothetical protein